MIGYGEILTCKPWISLYYNEAVQCGGMEGDIVEVQQTGCVHRLSIFKITVWGEELHCYTSDDKCGRFKNVPLI